MSSSGGALFISDTNLTLKRGADPTRPRTVVGDHHGLLVGVLRSAHDAYYYTVCSTFFRSWFFSLLHRRVSIVSAWHTTRPTSYSSCLEVFHSPDKGAQELICSSNDFFRGEYIKRHREWVSQLKRGGVNTLLTPCFMQTKYWTTMSMLNSVRKSQKW